MNTIKKRILGVSLLTASMFTLGGVPAMADDTAGPVSAEAVVNSPIGSNYVEVVIDGPMGPAPNFGLLPGGLAGVGSFVGHLPVLVGPAPWVGFVGEVVIDEPVIDEPIFLDPIGPPILLP